LPNALATAESYDPSTGLFTATGSMAGARQYFTATVLGNTIVEAGGLAGSTRLAGTELYHGVTFQPGANMTSPRPAHTATLLNHGSILFTGGQGSNGSSQATSELLK